MLVTTGGSSNAYSDLTRTLMEEIGVDLKFAGVSMRPGKGTSFGLYDDKPVFSLPGTPSAVYVVFHTLVLPALLRLMGLTPNGTACIKASLQRDMRKKPGVEHLVQGLISEQGSRRSVRPLVGQDIGVNGGVFRVTDGLFEKYGGARVIDTPLAESGILGTSIGMAIGAGHAGVRAMTGTSGGGFCLMCEHLGLAGIAEIPLVILHRPIRV